jgi:hypothetical protein
MAPAPHTLVVAGASLVALAANQPAASVGEGHFQFLSSVSETCTPVTFCGFAMPNIWLCSGASLMGDQAEVPTMIGEDPILNSVKNATPH